MAHYLLACPCGQSLPVDAARAGGEIECTCGEKLAVPPLRQLRQLPTAPTTAAAAPLSAWTWREGLLAAAILATAALLAVAAFLWFTRPRPPAFDPQEWREMARQQQERTTPAEAWETWQQIYKPLGESGFVVMRSTEEAVIATRAAQITTYVRVILGLAGLAAALAVIAAILRQNSGRLANSG